MRAGTSASPAESTLFPLKALIKLTRQYGDQLSVKAAIATVVRRRRLICQRRRLSLIRIFSLCVTLSRRRSLQTKEIMTNQNKEDTKATLQIFIG